MGYFNTVSVLGTVTDFRIIYLILSIADVSPIFLQLTLQPLTSVVFDNSSSLSNRAHAVGTFPIFCIVWSAINSCSFLMMIFNAIKDYKIWSPNVTFKVPCVLRYDNSDRGRYWGIVIKSLIKDWPGIIKQCGISVSPSNSGTTFDLGKHLNTVDRLIFKYVCMQHRHLAFKIVLKL